MPDIQDLVLTVALVALGLLGVSIIVLSAVVAVLGIKIGADPDGSPPRRARATSPVDTGPF